MGGMCYILCICGNIMRERANVLGHEAITLQGGALLPCLDSLTKDVKDI